MDRSGHRRRTARAVALGLLLRLASSCTSSGVDLGLSKSEEDESGIAAVAPPPQEGPRLGCIANNTPILERPASGAKTIGSLHAGSFVVRGAEPVRMSRHCPAGYYAIWPRGVVCLNHGATLDLEHPTLAAMALEPNLEQALPYTYGRLVRESPLLERDVSREDAVKIVRPLPQSSSFAVVGSWTARIGDGEPERLGLLTNGRFVRAADLEAARSSAFAGQPLRGGKALPMAFIVKRGVRHWKLDGARPQKAEPLDYHAAVSLTGRFRTISGTKYWATEQELWVRHQDVTLVPRRSKLPELARDNQRWIDVSVQLGTLVAYEGNEPVFATLVSAGRGRLGDGDESVPDKDVTRLGTFEVVAKHVTWLSGAPERAAEAYALLDLPWTLELASGQAVYGAYWHDRFGIEHGPGDLMLSPADAGYLFRWAQPSLPKGWHSVSGDTSKTWVTLRK